MFQEFFSSPYGPLLTIALFIASTATYFARFHKSGGSEENKEQSLPEFKAFQNLYLVVYVFAFLGDWLQGPYVYALYDLYGFAQRDIAVLFVAGFGSSMIFGTFIGSLADRWGRKRFAILYCITYILGCCTKHFNDYWILMLGRVLGGISTSLLFSVFDSWMVAEHNKRGFSEKLLSDTFSKAMFGNSLVAIGSGFLANFAADLVPLHESSFGVMLGGNTAPFDMAAIALAVCWTAMTLTWRENYGDASEGGAVEGLSLEAIRGGIETIRNSSKVFIIGAISSMFEGSMYTFVFLWTPLLQKADRQDLPFGVIFAILMLSCLTGSQLFGFLVKRMPPVKLAFRMYLVAACSLVLPVLSSSKEVLMVSFMVFEICVGIYWPCVGTLKGIYVPESQRSAIYNLFRIPLNAIVLVVLLSKVESQTSFLCCSVLLALGAFLTNKLDGLIAISSGAAPDATELDTLKAAEADAETDNLLSC